MKIKDIAEMLYNCEANWNNGDRESGQCVFNKEDYMFFLEIYKESGLMSCRIDKQLEKISDTLQEIQKEGLKVKQ